MDQSSETNDLSSICWLTGPLFLHQWQSGVAAGKYLHQATKSTWRHYILPTQFLYPLENNFQQPNVTRVETLTATSIFLLSRYKASVSF